MDEGQTVREITGRATGVLFLAGFGSIWLCAGLLSLQRLKPFGLIAVVAAPLLALSIPAISLLKRFSGTTPVAADSERERQFSQSFRRVNTMQWVAIVLAVVLLNIFHRTEWIVPAVAAIVGLHFLPLARLFRYSPHYVTGTLLVLWSAISVLFLRTENILSAGCLGTASILLLSAAYALSNALRAASFLHAE